MEANIERAGIKCHCECRALWPGRIMRFPTVI